MTDDIRLLRDPNGRWVRCPYNPQLSKNLPPNEIRLSKVSFSDTLVISRAECLRFMKLGSKLARQWCSRCPNRRAAVMFEPIGKAGDFEWVDKLIRKLQFTFGEQEVSSLGRARGHCCQKGQDNGVVVLQKVRLDIPREQRISKGLAKSVYKVIKAESKSAKHSDYEECCTHLWADEIWIGLSRR